MAQQQRVYPGEVIRSEFVNVLLGRLEDIESRLSSIAGTPSGVVVPDVVGRTLTNARTAIGQANLTVGSIYNAFGSSIPATQSGAQGLLVLNQDPVPGARAATGSAVLLVIAAKLDTGGKPKRPVIIDVSMKKPPILSMLAIEGENFEDDYSDHNVRFDGGEGTPLFLEGNKLFVRVPEFKSLPRNVNLIVTTPNGPSDPVQLQVVDWLDNVPTVDEVKPSGLGGKEVQIIGKNFNKEADHNLVLVSGAKFRVKKVKTTEVLHVELSEEFLKGEFRRFTKLNNPELVVVSEMPLIDPRDGKAKGQVPMCSPTYARKTGVNLDAFRP